MHVSFRKPGKIFERLVNIKNITALSLSKAAMQGKIKNIDRIYTI